MNDIAINLQEITKKYTLQHEKPTLVERFLYGKGKDFYALDNVTFQIKKGEKVGIIGNNGSGKTTILKIMAKITIPSTGKIEVYGKTVSLIGLEAGFHPDLVGVENIYLNGMILGMKKSEITEKLKLIIAYADIGKFIHEPLYTYSQGMKLRLSMAIALYSEPDIFFLDEDLYVGDQEFKNKIKTETNLLFNKNKTIVIVSHNLYTLFDYCKRIIILDKGHLIYDGGLEGIKVYNKNFTYDYIPPSVIKKLEKKHYGR